MHLEVEQKFPVASLGVIRQRLVEWGAQFHEPVDQADTYFSHPVRNFAQTDEALRLRRVGDTNCLTYKGPKLDAETKTRRELELTLPLGPAAFEQWAELLMALGFGVVATVRKRRESASLDWKGMRVEIALDTVAGVGPFAELEIATDDAKQAAAKLCLASLAKELGLAESERRSYLEMQLVNSP